MARFYSEHLTLQLFYRDLAVSSASKGYWTSVFTHERRCEYVVCIVLTGTLLTPVSSWTDEQCSFLVAIDAKTFQEVARAELPSSICLPFSLHGVFVWQQQQQLANTATSDQFNWLRLVWMFECVYSYTYLTSVQIRKDNHQPTLLMGR